LNTSIARLLSYLLHPLLVPTLFFGIIFFAAPVAISNLEVFNAQQSIDFFGLKLSFKGGLLLLVFFFTFLIPAYLLFILHKFRLIRSLTMENLADRRIPYLVVVLLYTVFSFASFRYLSLLPQLTVVMASVTFSISCVAFVSLYWQISAHATGMGGIVGGLLALTVRLGVTTLLEPLLVVILLAGLLMSARLRLNAHTPGQILAGFVLGFLVCGVTLYLYF
jgi:membrane-associated phospholipid phosphatase